MKITVKTKEVVEVKTLLVCANVRYWEDAEVNGVVDTDGKMIPCRNGDNWEPIIDIETGVITNWKVGTVASLHYKVCDEGIYKLLDITGKAVKKIDGYVPKILCPKEDGYGDYIIMEINESGRIHDWKINLEDFDEEVV